MGDCNTFSFGLINQLAATGAYEIDVVSFGRHPDWYPLAVPVTTVESITPVLEEKRYDFVFISNAHLIPMVLPSLQNGRAVFLCQGYESYYYGNTFTELREDCSVFDTIKSLPLSIIATSTSVQQLILHNTGRQAYTLPNAVDRDIFTSRSFSLASELPRPAAPKRVLMSGNYLAPHKGLLDGCRALEILSAQWDVELVLVTPEERQRTLLEGFSFPIEIHCKPPRTTLQAIYSSCDVYCSPAWYEGLGINGLEAFACGVPVVSTRNIGVAEYGIDNENLLLAEPNHPEDLARQLARLFQDPALAETLRTNGLKTLQDRYEWSTTVNTFGEILTQISQTPANTTPPTSAGMEALLRQIEAEGYFTPVAIYLQMKAAEECLQSLASEIETRQCVTETVVKKIQTLLSELKPLLTNPRTQYYDAAKSKADYCRMFLNFKEDPRFLASLPHLLSKKSFAGLSGANLPGV